MVDRTCLILLGLALYLPSASVSLVLMVLYRYCDSGLDSIESPGILTIIDGPEHDELSQVYSHLSSYHVGSHVPAYP